MKNLILLIFAMFLTASCTHYLEKVEFAPATNHKYSPKQENYNIKIFRSSLPERQYIELGIILARGGGVQSVFGSSDFYSKSIELLKEEARNQGGDAIIDIREKQGGSVSLTGTLIKWK